MGLHGRDLGQKRVTNRAHIDSFVLDQRSHDRTPSITVCHPGRSASLYIGKCLDIAADIVRSGDFGLPRPHLSPTPTKFKQNMPHRHFPGPGGHYLGHIYSKL